MALREVARAALEEAQEVLGEVSEGLGKVSEGLGEVSEGLGGVSEGLGGGQNPGEALGEALGAYEHARKGIGVEKGLREGSGVPGDGDRAGGLTHAGEGLVEASGALTEGKSGPEARDGEGAKGRATRGEGRGLPRGLGETGVRDEGWWEVHKRRREAAAEVACSAVDACAPLMGSKSVQNRWGVTMCFMGLEPLLCWFWFSGADMC
jgi:hypothetical protein